MQAAALLLLALRADAEVMTSQVLPSYRRTHPRGYWRIVAQELRNYCECRCHEKQVPSDARAVGLSTALFEAGSCRIDRAALLAHAKRPARLTIVVMAYIPEQNDRLDALVCGYADADMVQKVLVLWNGLPEDRPSPSCASNWKSKQNGFYRGILNPTTEVEVIVEPTNTLLNRYRHAKRVPTASVVLQDDDVFHHSETLDAFGWGRIAAPSQILGTYPERTYRLNDQGLYEYVFHPRKTRSKEYSFLLGQTSVVRSATIDDFIRGAPRQALAFIISHKPTCEDMTFHFFNANASGLPPIVFEDLEPVRVQGTRAQQIHTQTGKKLHNARRERCLNRLAEEFGGMALVRSKCRLRGNVTRLLERDAAGDRLWMYRDAAVAAAASTEFLKL